VAIGDFRRRCAIRIDDDELRIALASRFRDMRHDVDLGRRRIAAPHDDQVRVGHLARIGAHLGADAGHPAGIDECGADGRVLTRIAHDVAQALDAVALHEAHGPCVIQRPHRGCAEALGRAHELFGHFVERRLPRERRKFAGALGARAP